MCSSSPRWTASFLITQRSRKPSLGSEAAAGKSFEFRATLTNLGDGLDTLHHSVELLREAIGRSESDRPLMLFETALGEIGGNVLTHGRPPGIEEPVEYVLRLERGYAIASFTDPGPEVDNHLGREMPGHHSEAGRGLAMARELLDEFGYERERGVNRWRLVKRL